MLPADELPRLVVTFFAALVVVATVVPASAHAQRAEISQQLFSSAGLPSLVVNPVPDGSLGSVTGIEACPPGAPCVAAAGLDDGLFDSPIDVPVGTVFRASVRATRTGRVTVATSASWQGRVQALAVPALDGAPRVGAMVRPVGVPWSGGWGDERSLRGVEACRTAAGTGCVTLGGEELPAPVCPRGAAVLDARYAGWFVRAVDVRWAADTATTLEAYGRPEAIEVAPAAATIARSPLVGPIAKQHGRFAECARPRASVIKRPQAQRGFTVLGIVQCTSGCETEVIVRDGKRTIRRLAPPRTTRPLSRLGGYYTDAVGLPSSVHLRSRQVRVRIRVNGRTRAAGTIRLPGR